MADLLNLDHRAFWAKRLLLMDVDWAHLGRLVNNAATNSKRRRRWVQRWPHSGLIYDFDLRAGALIERIFGSTQAIIDELRHKIRVGNCLRKIDVSELLPTADPRSA
jgi:hypothetical protein